MMKPQSEDPESLYIMCYFYVIFRIINGFQQPYSPFYT